jgi:hypothetical protein
VDKQENRILTDLPWHGALQLRRQSRQVCVSLNLRAMTTLHAIQVGWKREESLAKKLHWLKFQENLVGSVKKIGGRKSGDVDRILEIQNSINVTGFPPKLSLCLSMSTLLKNSGTFCVQ